MEKTDSCIHSREGEREGIAREDEGAVASAVHYYLLFVSGPSQVTSANAGLLVARDDEQPNHKNK